MSVDEAYQDHPEWGSVAHARRNSDRGNFEVNLNTLEKRYEWDDEKQFVSLLPEEERGNPISPEGFRARKIAERQRETGVYPVYSFVKKGDTTYMVRQNVKRVFSLKCPHPGWHEAPVGEPEIVSAYTPERNALGIERILQLRNTMRERGRWQAIDDWMRQVEFDRWDFHGNAKMKWHAYQEITGALNRAAGNPLVAGGVGNWMLKVEKRVREAREKYLELKAAAETAYFSRGESMWYADTEAPPTNPLEDFGAMLKASGGIALHLGLGGLKTKRLRPTPLTPPPPYANVYRYGEFKARVFDYGPAGNVGHELARVAGMWLGGVEAGLEAEAGLRMGSRFASLVAGTRLGRELELFKEFVGEKLSSGLEKLGLGGLRGKVGGAWDALKERLGLEEKRYYAPDIAEVRIAQRGDITEFQYRFKGWRDVTEYIENSPYAEAVEGRPGYIYLRAAERIGGKVVPKGEPVKVPYSPRFRMTTVTDGEVSSVQILHEEGGSIIVEGKAVGLGSVEGEAVVDFDLIPREPVKLDVKPSLWDRVNIARSIVEGDFKGVISRAKIDIDYFSKKLSNRLTQAIETTEDAGAAGAQLETLALETRTADVPAFPALKVVTVGESTEKAMARVLWNAATRLTQGVDAGLVQNVQNYGLQENYSLPNLKLNLPAPKDVPEPRFSFPSLSTGTERRTTKIKQKRFVQIDEPVLNFETPTVEPPSLSFEPPSLNFFIPSPEGGGGRRARGTRGGLRLPFMPLGGLDALEGGVVRDISKWFNVKDILGV